MYGFYYLARKYNFWNFNQNLLWMFFVFELQPLLCVFHSDNGSVINFFFLFKSFVFYGFSLYDIWLYLQLIEKFTIILISAS